MRARNAGGDLDAREPCTRPHHPQKLMPARRTATGLRYALLCMGALSLLAWAAPVFAQCQPCMRACQPAGAVQTAGLRQPCAGPLKLPKPPLTPLPPVIPEPVRLMVLLDRSYSMLWALADCDDKDRTAPCRQKAGPLPRDRELMAQNKWADNLKKLIQVFRETNANRVILDVRFMVFPRGDGEVGRPETIDEVSEKLPLYQDISWSGDTPLATALSAALSYQYDASKDSRPKVILLITDGYDFEKRSNLKKHLRSLSSAVEENARDDAPAAAPTVSAEHSALIKACLKKAGEHLPQKLMTALAKVAVPTTFLSPSNRTNWISELQRIATAQLPCSSLWFGSQSRAAGVVAYDQFLNPTIAHQTFMRAVKGLYESQFPPPAEPECEPPPSEPAVPVCASTTPDTLSDALAIGRRGNWHCSAVAVSPSLVLTARHCLPADTVGIGADARTPERIHRVLATHTAPDASVDAALLEVEPPMAVTIHARRHHGETEPPQGVARLMGFGAIDLQGLYGFGRKHIVEVPVSGWGCDPQRAATVGCMPDWELTIAGTAGRDTCDGDSGGPVFEQTLVPSPCCPWRLIGITSRPMVTARLRCGGGGIYVRVDRLDDWIERISLAAQRRATQVPKQAEAER